MLYCETRETAVLSGGLIDSLADVLGNSKATLAVGCPHQSTYKYVGSMSEIAAAATAAAAAAIARYIDCSCADRCHQP